MSRASGPIGASVARPDAARHVRGNGRFTDDIVPANAAHVAFLRSPWAHARIAAIETAAARAVPGVIAVLTGVDVARVCRPWTTRLAMLPGHVSAPQQALAIDEVCWQGEAVAAVVATSRAAAEDALQVIEVDWQPLDAVATIAAAIAPDAPAVHSSLSGNIALDHTFSAGDVEAGIAAAAIVVEHRMVFGRQAGVTLEPRCITAKLDRRLGELLVTISHQVPFQVQDVLAAQLGLPASRVRVIAPDVGGAFGLKLHGYADEIAVAAIAMLVDRPVTFSCDRLEAFASDAQSREAEVTGRLAVDANGRIVALEVDVVAGFGAYSCYPRSSVGEALQAGQIAGAPYEVPSFKARVRGVYQSKPPNAAFRGVGQPIAVAVTEQLIDIAAARVGLDPAEMRRLNYRKVSTTPGRTAGGVVVGRVSQHQCLDSLRCAMDYDRLRREQAELAGRGIHRGIGLSSFLELTAVGTGQHGPNAVRVSAHEACRLSLLPSGEVRCDSSITDQGQGTATGIAQIIAAELSLSPAEIDVVTGDTHRVPYGGGAWASRGLALGGEAALKAARRLRHAVLAIAGALLQSDPTTLSLRDGFVVKADGMPAMSLRDIASMAHFRAHEIPLSPLPSLEVVETFAPTTAPYFTANGIIAAHVEVDVETGFVRLLDIWAVEDCGRVINPLLVDEQIRGGIVQGIGAALFEECLYRQDGQLENGSLADYLVPMAAELCDIHVSHVETETGESELGARGVGEAGTVGALGAIWTAVNDALRPLGAQVTQQPFTPERVLEALDRATAGYAPRLP